MESTGDHKQTDGTARGSTRFAAAALTRKGTPRCVRPWWVKWFVGLPAAGLLGCIFWWALVYMGLSGSLLSTVTLFSAVTGAYFARWALYDRHVEKLRDRLIAEKLALCLKCGYSLTGLPYRHRCPECGQQYDLAETTGHWLKWMDAIHYHIDSFALGFRRRRLEEWIRQYERGVWRHCGHDLRGAGSPTCPGCGAEQGG